MKNTNFKRFTSLALAGALVFTLNLGSLEVNAAEALKAPTATTDIGLPEGVQYITINNEAEFAEIFQDNNGDDTLYIRPADYGENAGILQYSTTLDELQNAAVSIYVDDAGTTAVTSSDVNVSESGNVYTFTADLLNKTQTVNIGGTDYEFAAGIPTYDSTLADVVTVGGVAAKVHENVNASRFPGNAYYAQNGTSATYLNYYIKTTENLTEEGVKSAKVVLNGTDLGTYDFSTGSGKVTADGRDYTVLVTVAGKFIVNETNFWIDFRELEAYEKENGALEAGFDWKTINEQKIEIENAMKAYQQEHRVFTDATCMDVLQDFFKYAIDDNTLFTHGTTTYEDNCLYVEKINGLAPRTISGCMDGWMYTDDPYKANTLPKNWYTAPIGASDYSMSPTTNIAWFFTTNYGDHPW